MQSCIRENAYNKEYGNLDTHILWLVHVSWLAGILVNSVDPGWVATDMGGHGGRPVHEGAKGIVWAATLSNGGPSGGFFCDGKAVPWWWIGDIINRFSLENDKTSVPT